MGIRFACHACGKPLNIKDSLAGKRGKCPACGTRFRIPLEDQDRSIPLESTSNIAEAGQQPDEAAPVDRTSSAVANRDAARPDTSPELGPVPGAKTASPVTPSAAAEPLEASHQPAEPGRSANDATVAVEEATTPPAVPRPASDFDPLEEPHAQWYVRPPAGGRFGPADGPTVRQWISEGRITRDTLLWREEWPQWREFSDVLPEAFPPAAPAGITPAPMAPTPPTASGVQPRGATPGPVQPTPAVGGTTGRLDPESYLGAKKRRKARRRAVIIAVLVATSLVLILALAVALLGGLAS